MKGLVKIILVVPILIVLGFIFWLVSMTGAAATGSVGLTLGTMLLPVILLIALMIGVVIAIIKW